MEITEVRIKLMENTDDRLRAFCSITFDNSFVVRDLKIIDGSSGPFVAMPSRKLTAHCGRCGYKNHLKAPYCNQCGDRLREDRLSRDSEGRTKLYADIAHPINSVCREMIQNRVIAEFQAELGRSQQPGYVSRYDDDYGFDENEPPSSSPAIGAAEIGMDIQPPAAEPLLTEISSSVVPPPHLIPLANDRGGDLPAPHKIQRSEAVEESSKAAENRGRNNFGAGILD